MTVEEKREPVENVITLSEVDDNELKMEVEPDLEREMKYKGMDEYEIFNDQCGDNDKPDHSRILRYRDSSISSDEMATRSNPKRKPCGKKSYKKMPERSSPNTSTSSGTKTVSLDSSDVCEITDNSSNDSDEDPSCEDMLSAISDDNKIKANKDKIREYNELASKDLKETKKKLEKEITKTTDKVKGKLTKKVAKVIKSDNNIKLNELKAELEAIKYVEAGRNKPEPKKTKRWTSNEAKTARNQMRANMNKLQRTIDEGKARKAKKGTITNNDTLESTIPAVHIPRESELGNNSQCKVMYANHFFRGRDKENKPPTDPTNKKHNTN